MKENYFFIHNSFAHFYDGVLTYMADYLYPRFSHRVIGTYDKAVEYINKKSQYGDNEHDMPNLPAIILNPTGDFTMAEADAGGKQLFRYPNLGNGAVRLARIYDPIYKDEQVLVTPAFSRVQGEIEIIMLLNSFYEYCDMKMFMYQIFGGLDRPIYPKDYTSFIIMPEEFLNYTYENEVTGQTYQPDWGSAGLYNYLVRTTNRNELVIPYSHHASLTLTGMNDGSNRYGTAEKLAEWRLSCSIRYEVELPWYLLLQSDYMYNNISLNISANVSMVTPKKISDFESFDHTKLSFETGMDSTSHNAQVNLPDSAEIVARSGFKKVESFYYEITQSDEILEKLTIFVPEHINEDNVIFIDTKYGELDPYIHYWIMDVQPEGITIDIINNSEYFTNSDVIEVYIYEREGYPTV